MSILFIPSRNNTFHTMVDLERDEAEGFIEHHVQRLQSDSDRNVRDRGDIFEDYVEFEVEPGATVNRDVETRVATLLRCSRVRGASGARAVFVDLAEGTILVGTTVVYNDRHATLHLNDPSLQEQIDFISAVFSAAADGQGGADAGPGEEAHASKGFNVDELPTLADLLSGKLDLTKFGPGQGGFGIFKINTGDANGAGPDAIVRALIESILRGRSHD